MAAPVPMTGSTYCTLVGGACFSPTGSYAPYPFSSLREAGSLARGHTALMPLRHARELLPAHSPGSVTINCEKVKSKCETQRGAAASWVLAAETSPQH